jgi:hypothetical protein
MNTKPIDYSKKSNARRAAIADLGPDAKEGVDYRLVPTTGGRWTYEKIAAGREERIETRRQDRLQRVRAHLDEFAAGAGAGIADDSEVPKFLKQGRPKATPQVAPIAGMAPLGAGKAKGAKGAAAKGKAPAKQAKPAKAKAAPAGGETKTQVVIRMLKAPGGTSLKEIRAATDWGCDVRALAARHELDLKVTGKGRETRYSVAA